MHGAAEASSRVVASLPRIMFGFRRRKTKIRTEVKLKRFAPNLRYADDIQDAKRYSMLHREALALLKFFAGSTPGGILEIGPYVGGSTVAMAKGVSEAGPPTSKRPFVTVEAGGSYEEHRNIPTSDIVADLRKHLAEAEVSDRVKVVVGRSDDPVVMAEVDRGLNGEKIGLFVIDADGDVERDFGIYFERCRPGCVVIVDDYYSHKGAIHKMDKTKPVVDRLTEEGVLEPFGVFGWGTWMGRLVRHPAPASQAGAGAED